MNKKLRDMQIGDTFKAPSGTIFTVLNRMKGLTNFPYFSLVTSDGDFQEHDMGWNWSIGDELEFELVEDPNHRVLFIDDTRTPPFPCTLIRDAKSALKILPHQKWAEVWFDHDLGKKGDIRKLVIEIEKQAFEGKPFQIGKCFIHTKNPVGRKWLEQALSKYYPVQVVVNVSKGDE